MNNQLSHKLHILKTLLESKVKLTATDFSYISNANQYFVELESQELIKSKWSRKKGKTPFKLRFVSKKCREKAEDFFSLHTTPNEAKKCNS